jgi:putative ABC transport system permease protein
MTTTLLHDLRYALRQLRKSLGFTFVAVLTLALGIAVNATMFGLVSAFLLRRPAGRDPNRIAVISSVSPDGGFQPEAWPRSVPNYLALRDDNRVFTEVTAADEGRTVNLSGNDRPELIRSAAVAPDYFDVFGVSPQMGRSFLPGEDQAGRDHVVILSHDLWERRFGSDPAIVGRTIRLNRENWDVIGVMPANFQLMGFTAQLWTPLVLNVADQNPAARKDRSLYVFARMKPGVTIEQARSEIIAQARRAQVEFPEYEKGWGATVRTLPDFLIYDFGIRTGIVILMTTVGFVLLIACANVAGLLLARAAGRQRELSIRLSLGARRWDIVRQLLAETLVIGLVGGAMGLLLADWGIKFVRASLNFNEAISAVPVTLDWNVLFFAVGISLISALLCGLAPALKASGNDINAALNDESRGSSPGRAQSRLRNVLVTSEIALALFLLVGAGLLMRGLFLVEHQNLGFQPEHLLTADLTLDEARYKGASDQTLFVQNLLSRLEQIPGVEAVAAASDLPATGSDNVTVGIKDRPELPNSQRLSALDVVVSTDYLRAAGIPLLRGRSFTEMDNSAAPRVVLVNEEFVRRHMPGQEPLGKQIRVDVKGVAPEWGEIVGVVGNVKTFSEEARDDPEVYEAFLQRPDRSFSVMLRAHSDPNSLASALRATVAQIDGELPLAHVMSMPALIDLQKGGDPFFTTVMGGFAFLALILAAIGIYGLIAYSVGRRTHEMGIRMALGARSGDLLVMVLRQGLKMAVLGAGIGLVLALPLPKAFESMFPGLNLQFREPRLYLLVPAAILLVATLATYIPARRAGKVDPMVALRYE